MNEEKDVEGEVENESKGEYPARCEPHKRKERKVEGYHRGRSS